LGSASCGDFTPKRKTGWTVKKPTTSEPARLLLFKKRENCFEVAQVADETFSFDRQLQLLFKSQSQQK
jgi:hypothetical protein